MNIKLIGLITFIIITFSLHSKNIQVPTDIFYALDQGDFRGVRAWAKNNPDVTVRSKQGHSILTAAVLTGNYKLVQAVLKASIDVNWLDGDGKTVLDWAAEEGNEKIILKLVKHGAKVTNAENESLVITMLKRKSASILKRGLFFIFVVPLAIIGILWFGIWAEWYVRPYIGYQVGLTLLDIVLPVGALCPVVGLGISLASTSWHVRSHGSYILKS